MKDDLISRAAAIDALREEVEWEYDWNDEQMYYIEADMAIGAIERLPSAERPTGKWVDAVIPNDNGDLLVQVCDQCSTFFPLEYTGGGHHFCPNCGARMKGGEDSEND